MADKGIKYIGTNRVKNMALGSQEGHKLYLGETLLWEDPIIEFDDPAVKTICVTNWGGSVYPNEITEREAANVTDVLPVGGHTYFKGCQMTTFNEFKYFVGLTRDTGQSYAADGIFANCTKLGEITLPPMRGMSNFNGLFYNCVALSNVDLSPIGRSTAVRINHMFRQSGIAELDLRPLKTISSFTSAFQNMSKLTTLNLTGCDFSGASASASAFASTANLTTIIGGLAGFRYSLDFSGSGINAASAIEVLFSLGSASGSQTIKFKSALYNTLNSDTSAGGGQDAMTYARGKGFTVTS